MPLRRRPSAPRFSRLVGDDLGKLKPGSREAMDLKAVLMAQGAWSQYLEVGIGPDAEVFTKAPTLSAVGPLMDAGYHPKSTWNNPEPEVVVVVSPDGRIVGACLGNDVNLRDVEGRSALLLSKAKDNNASCAIGPFIRFFDESFSLDDVRNTTVTLTVEGEDGYRLEGSSSITKISRDPEDLVAQTIGPQPSISRRIRAVSRHHVRADPGPGRSRDWASPTSPATSSPSRRPKLGALVNRMRHSSECEPWTFGLGALMATLPRRGLIKAEPHIMTLHAKNFIAGEWIAAANAAPDVNPSNTNDVVGEFARADAARCRARRSRRLTRPFRPGRARRSRPRHDILKNIGDEIIARKDELGRLLSREEGKTLPEGIGEATRAGQIFQFFSGECLRLAGEKIASVRPGVDIEITREPIGVVGLITPWNFPIAIPAWKIAPALAYGNCVVFKPADLVPASAHALSEIIVRAGDPGGVFNLVMGRGSVVGEAMLNDPKVAAISFTGSVRQGGRSRRPASRSDPMKKMQLEMGGKNPLVVLDDADLKVAVECAVNGAFFSTGQRCTASSRFIVTHGIHDRFVDAITERMKGLVIDDALKAGTQIGPVVDQNQLDQDLNYIRIGQDEGRDARRWRRASQSRGARVLSFAGPVHRRRTENANRPRGNLWPGGDGHPRHAITTRRWRSPTTRRSDCRRASAPRSLKHAGHFKRNSEAGMVMVNLPTAGVDYHVPFGGRKGSSYGPREQGRYAQEFYTTVKTAYTVDGN